MLPLDERIAQANTTLASYAVPHEGPGGREFPDPPDGRRFPFQRDRDRIVHTEAFRRLQGKTQVFPATDTNDHFRSRLTHTVEVVQIARDLARSLQLNEDLAECIALAHDLGHPPFGHAGEEAIDAWMQTHGLTFEHNEQSLRLVTVLEEHASEYLGLNLQREVLDGLKKHTLKDAQHTLEAQIVDMADEIAYTAHDCEDALRGQLFTVEDIMHIPLIREGAQRSSERGTALLGGLLKILVEDLLQSTNERIAQSGIRTPRDVQRLPHILADLSPAMREKLQEWRTFLYTHLYLHPRVIGPMEEGQRLLVALAQRLFESPSAKILELQKRTQSSLPEAVKDYIAGMTDAFAQSTGKELGIRI